MWRGSISAGDCRGSNSGMLGNACQPCRHAHHPGPDLEAKRQYSAREWVVQAIGGELGEAHLVQQGRAQFSLKERCRFFCKICSDGTTCRMQRDGYTIAGERGDDGCLIADAVEPVLGCAADVSIRDMGDGDRLGQQRLRAGKPHGKVWTVLLHLREEVLPAMSDPCKIPLLHHAAQVCNAAFDRLDTAIAARIEHQLRRARKLRGLRGR